MPPPNLDTLDLWPHQRAAADVAEAYFASGVEKGCLMHMPTGTGKTGVMAAISSRRAHAAAVLVVCPSAALAEQLVAQIGERFWEKVAAPVGWAPDAVHQLLPSNAAELAGKLAAPGAGKTILVATIQAVQQAYAAGALTVLVGHIGTILFDEGHREPAPTWGRVIRSFGVPTILFSATPFRGDLRIFDVADEFIHFLSFGQAVEERLIRGVEVDERDLALDAGLFAQQLVARVDELAAEGRFAAQDKVIVRCDSEAHVTEMYLALTQALGERGDGVLAMHDTFKRGQGGMLDAVPRDLSARAERFLVHQFMLIEGIDDPKCTMLALFNPFGNTRMLVQQIGRLIRHPGHIGEEVAPAYVLARTGSGVAEDWESFRRFDQASAENGGKSFLRNDDQVLKNLIAALPTLDYVGGKFKSRVDFDNPETETDVRFPSSAVAFSIAPDLDMARLEDAVKGALDADDRHVAFDGEVAGGDCRYHLTLKMTPSPFLANSLFHSASLEATIYAKCGERLFFYDSAGLWINELDEVGPRIASVQLRALLPEGADNTISFINVKNSDLGPLALRSRSLSARSLALSGVFMGEHLNVVTRAVGTLRKDKDDKIGTQRAIGFARSRIRDGKGTDLTAEEFAAWCADIGEQLDAAAQTASLFNRFAAPVNPPAVTTPVNILIDMVEVRADFRSEGADRNGIEIEDLCVAIEPDTTPGAPAPYRFKLRVEDLLHDVWIKWIPKKRKYWLISPGLSSIKTNDNPRISLTNRLNARQPFRILVDGLKHSYVGGDFYELDLNLRDPNGPAKVVLDLIKPIKALGDIKSEKGVLTNGHRPGWDTKSLFHFIDEALRADKRSKALGLPFPNVVCDDLQDEVGDFIAFENGTSPRATIVAAKAKGGNPGVSASAFYDVCAQGVKNLAFMKSDGRALPGGVNRFDTPWKLSKKKTNVSQTVDRRRCGLSSAAFKRGFVQVRASPSTERAIWLVCGGGMLSLDKLKTEFGKPAPEPHVLQFYHLVMSTYSACQSVGVQLKIFCAE